MTTDVDFGFDISVTTSLRTGRFASHIQLVGEACYRRLTTPRGMLRGGEEEANYGLDLTEQIGQSNPATVAVTLPGKISSELLKDERVLSATAVVNVQTNGPSSIFLITIDVMTAAGPFTLKVSASDVSTELLGIT